MAHLAFVEDDNVARALSWHMGNDMDCCIITNSDKVFPSLSSISWSHLALPRSGSPHLCASSSRIRCIVKHVCNNTPHKVINRTAPVRQIPVKLCPDTYINLLHPYAGLWAEVGGKWLAPRGYLLRTLSGTCT